MKMMDYQMQPYQRHLQESKLWLLLFLLTAAFRYLYIPTHWDNFISHQSVRPIEDCTSNVQVQATTKHYCSLEADLLCPNPSYTDCVDDLGYPMTPFLHAFSISDLRKDPILESRNCTLIGRNQNIDKEFSNRTEEEQEKMILVRVMMSSIQRLYLLLKNESVETQHRFIDFYFRKFFCLYGYKQEHLKFYEVQWQLRYRKRVFESDLSLWTPHEFFQLLNLARVDALTVFHNVGEGNKTHMSVDNSNVATSIDHISTSIKRRRQEETENAENAENTIEFTKLMHLVLQTFEEEVFEYPNSGKSICQELRFHYDTGHQNLKDQHQVLSSEHLNECILRYYHTDMMLLSDTCVHTIDDAIKKMDELNLMDRGGFLFLSHLFFLAVNLVSFVVLLAMINSKQSLEQRMDRGQQRLEQELNDDFLRRVLESKANEIEEDGGRNLILRLEEKLRTWDSKKAANNILDRHLHSFRLMTIFTMSLTTMVYLLLHVFHISSLPRYLEIMSISTGMMAFSYYWKK